MYKATQYNSCMSCPYKHVVMCLSSVVIALMVVFNVNDSDGVPFWVPPYGRLRQSRPNLCRGLDYAFVGALVGMHLYLLVAAS